MLSTEECIKWEWDDHLKYENEKENFKYISFRIFDYHKQFLHATFTAKFVL